MSLVMQKIDKLGSIPPETVNGFKKYKTKNWGNIPESIKAPLRQQLYDEQHGVCCYCCKSLDKENTTIEHLQSRNDYPHKCFDYDNLLLSCRTPKQCDNAKGSQELPLTPLMNECESEINLNLAGELDSDSKRGVESIEILNLNNRQICSWRKSLIDTISFVFDPTQSSIPPIGIQDLETLELILNSYPDLNQKHELEYIVKKLTR